MLSRLASRVSPSLFHLEQQARVFCGSRGSSASDTSAAFRQMLAAGVAVAATGACVLADDALSWGWGGFGQLGNGSEADIPVPKGIDFFKGKKVSSLKSCGSCNSTAALTSNGDLYTFGCGKDGRLGHGLSIDAPNQDTPRLVSVPGKSFKSVAVGEYHMAAITVDGEVYAFGKNNRGQLGVAAEAGTPVLVDSLAGVKAVAVACGRQHSLVLDDSGAVFGFGDNTLGAVGSGAKAIVRTPVRIEFPTPEKVVEIACGRDHSLFLTAGGSVFATGADSDGQLGDGFADLKQFAPIRIKAFDGIKIEKIIAGENHSIAITCDGQAWTWGSSSHGQLGHGSKDNLGLPRKIEALEGVRIVDGAAGGAHTLLLSAKGVLYAFGRGRNGQLGQPIASASYKTLPVEVSMPAPVVSISAGENHSLAIVKS